MGKYCDGMSADCDGANYPCDGCGNCDCYCQCPCPHDDQEINDDLSDGLMAWVCQDCGVQTSGFIGQFGVLHKGN